MIRSEIISRMSQHVIIFILLLISQTVVSDWKPFVSSEDEKTIYEPSGLVQLHDGRLLVVQDEASDPFVLFELEADKAINYERPLLKKDDKPFWVLGNNHIPYNLDDLEGITKSPDGFLYAITSHSRTETGGKHKKSRQKLVRFKIDGDKIVQFQTYKKLRKAIGKAFPVLKQATKELDAKSRKGFNIEGLAFDASSERLLIGLRGPVIDDDSIIITLKNPKELFDSGSKPDFLPELVYLPLKKGGIRALSYVDSLQGYLIVTQRAKKDKKSNKNFKLWFVKSLQDPEPVRLKLDGMDLRRAEGVSVIHNQGQEQIMLVSDDGNRVTDNPAQYLLLPVERLLGDITSVSLMD